VEESGLRLAGGWREREQTVGGRSALRRNAARFLDAFEYDKRSTGLKHACAVSVCPLNICADNTAICCAGNNIGLNPAGGRRGCSGRSSGRRPNAQSRNQQSTREC
jgi:hypothetical protein